MKPQKQPVVESELIATTEAKVSVVNLFERDIESTFIHPVIRLEAVRNERRDGFLKRRLGFAAESLILLSSESGKNLRPFPVVTKKSKTPTLAC